MRRVAIMAVLLLACRAAYGQIDVPAEVEAYHFVDCELQAVIPEGAYLADGGWDIVPDDPKVVLDADQLRPNGNKCSFVGPPGDYSILYDGVILIDVTFTDATGKEITVRNYLGKAKGRARCKIKGGNDPLPPPPPPVDQKWRIMLFYDGDKLDNYLPTQQLILTSLYLRQKLKESGHELLGVLESKAISGAVASKYQPWIDAVKGKPLPRVAIAPKDETGTVLDFPLPSTEKEFLELLYKPELAAFYRVKKETKK